MQKICYRVEAPLKQQRRLLRGYYPLCERGSGRVVPAASAFEHRETGHGGSTGRRTYEVCGPERFTLRQLVKLAGSLSGHPRPVVGLPDVLARLQAFLMELAPGQPLMSRDNLDSMKVNNVASGKLPGLDALGISPSALGAIAPTYLGIRR